MRKFNTLFVGKVVLHFPQLNSTNLYAVDYLAKTKPAEGTVISTDAQSAGRGQIGRSWYSEPGQNLQLSIILYPRWLVAREQFALSQAIGLAVANTVSELSGVEALVKWPNDIYVGKEKIAGILIQNSLAGAQLQWSVVGVGLNVNQASFPADIPNPTSLQLIAGCSFELSTVQELLFARIEQAYLQLKTAPERIRKSYHERLYRLNQWASYEITASQERLQARITGINEQGKLALELSDGSLAYYGLQEVKFI